MFKEAIEEITGTAVKAAGPQPREIDPTRLYIVLNDSGKHELIGNEVPLRKHKAQNLETIAAFADKFPGGAVWVARDKIVFLTDDADRRQSVTVAMTHSDEIRKLTELQKSRPRLPQRDFLFLLRTVFTQNALPQFPTLIDGLRKVNFKQATEAEGTVQRGKSSVGKSIATEASYIETIPEQVVLNVPVFENAFASTRFNVRCALEIYEAEMTLQLFPLPGEVEAAYAAAEMFLCGCIRDLLGEESQVPIYLGTP